MSLPVFAREQCNRVPIVRLTGEGSAMSRAFLVLIVSMPAFANLARSAETPADGVLAPASNRYRAADALEVPDFQRHVVPLLGRLGCSGRACHGSFQGQGGFRLSL